MNNSKEISSLSLHSPLAIEAKHTFESIGNGYWDIAWMIDESLAFSSQFKTPESNNLRQESIHRANKALALSKNGLTFLKQNNELSPAEIGMFFENEFPSLETLRSHIQNSVLTAQAEQLAYNQMIATLCYLRILTYQSYKESGNVYDQNTGVSYYSLFNRRKTLHTPDYQAHVLYWNLKLDTNQLSSLFNRVANTAQNVVDGVAHLSSEKERITALQFYAAGHKLFYETSVF